MNIKHKNSKIFPYWYSYLSLFGQLWRLLSACMSIRLSVCVTELPQWPPSLHMQMLCNICRHQVHHILRIPHACTAGNWDNWELPLPACCFCSCCCCCCWCWCCCSCFCWRVHKVQFSLPLATRHRVNKDLCRFFMSYWLLHTNKSQIFSIVGCFCLFL